MIALKIEHYSFAFSSKNSFSKDLKPMVFCATYKNLFRENYDYSSLKY